MTFPERIRLHRSLERALGEKSAMLMHRNLKFWRTTTNEAAIEEWWQQQVARMFCRIGLAMPLGYAAEQALALSGVP